MSADMISRACFGSSHSQGEKIFSQIRALQKVTNKGSCLRRTTEKWRLEKEIKSEILELVKQRSAEVGHEKDLLQMILEGAICNLGHHSRPSSGLSLDKFIVDNCKNIYYAGHESTAMVASRSLMLLAAHPDWQARVHAEVLQICNGNILDCDMLRSMKLLTMVIQETLRHYPSADFVMREFNPDRFANGILGACKHPQAYLPFRVGARICIGQRFAMTELKVVLSLMLSKFSVSLSPVYQHYPLSRMASDPEHGICLHVRRLSLL
ncbi:hypothetical protein DITRI_Ditri13aG0010500 [Diplodiscus trichospermus]